MTREEQFLANLPEIERAIRWVCVRRGLRGADAEDFASTVKLRLIENDYAVLAKFQGRCSLRTFLTVVITRLYLDQQTHRFGKWRSSAEALRLGPVAVRLERLMLRDKLTFDEACGVLLSDPQVRQSRDALHAMAARFPVRHRLGRQEVPVETADPRDRPAVIGMPRPREAVDRSDRQTLADRTFGVIRALLAELPARERLVLRLNLAEGLTLAQVARSLGLDQKALYKRREKLFVRLRADLESAGVGRAEAEELLAKGDWDVELFDDIVADDPGGEEAGIRPSRSLSEAGLGKGES